MIKLGALWSRKSKAGKPYINGILDLDKMPEGDKCNVVVFHNDRKSKDTSPDFIVYLSEPIGAGGYGKSQKPAQGDFFGGGQEEVGDGAVPDDDAPW